MKRLKNVYSINKWKGICKVFINLKENEKSIINNNNNNNKNNNNNNNIRVITFSFLNVWKNDTLPQTWKEKIFHPLHLFDQT